jgi:uncharacterized coiled-coil protein SlyX
MFKKFLIILLPCFAQSHVVYSAAEVADEEQHDAQRKRYDWRTMEYTVVGIGVAGFFISYVAHLDSRFCKPHERMPISSVVLFAITGGMVGALAGEITENIDRGKKTLNDHLRDYDGSVEIRNQNTERFNRLQDRVAELERLSVEKERRITGLAAQVVTLTNEVDRLKGRVSVLEQIRDHVTAAELGGPAR